MGAITRFVGPKAKELADKYLNILKMRQEIALETIEVNGKVEIWEVGSEGMTLKNGNATIVELGTNRPSTHEDILQVLTYHEEGVFGTADQVVHTMGAADGNVY
jgi:hypothetical protein